MTPEMRPSDEQVASLVRDGYNTIAEKYAAYAEESVGHPRHEWVERLISQLEPGSRVLELGCGPGIPTAAAIAGAGHKLIGVDISAGQLEIARKRVPSATFVEADFLTLVLEDESFDAVVALYSITHAPRHRYPELFARIRSWLRPGGWFLGTFGTGDSAGWLEEDLLGFGASSWTNSFDRATTEQLLTAAGLFLQSVELVEQVEPTGKERWLYVLARPH